MTIQEQLLTTPLSVVTDVVPSIGVCNIDSLDGQCRQIAQTNQQISLMLNAMSDKGVTIGDLLASVGSKSLPGAVMALNSIQDASPNGILTVDNALALLSMIDIGCRGTADTQQLLPAGRKSRGGVQQALQAVIGIVENLPLSSAWKLALRAGLNGFSGSLALFAPEIWDLVIFGIKSIEYEIIELVIDKIFRDNAAPGESGKGCQDALDILKKALIKDDKSILDDVAYAVRQGLVDFERANDWKGESEHPASFGFDGRPVFKNSSLVWRLMDAVTSVIRDASGDAVARTGGVVQPGQTVARRPDSVESLWALWQVASDAFLMPNRDIDGNIIVGENNEVLQVSRFPDNLEERFLKAFLKESRDENGTVITDAQGRPVLTSIFDATMDLTPIKEAFLRVKLDADGQPILDSTGKKQYEGSYLIDIIDALNQTQEVWSLDGVRLFLRERLVQWQDTGEKGV